MFKRYPFIKQEGTKDCGVSSLLMIIKYYKGYIGIEELRNMTKTTKNGTTAYHLIETAKKIGFESKGVKCEINDITKDNIILPCIAHVTLDNMYKHYIVIYEINFKKKIILIADPSSKIKKLSFDAFEKIWNNVLIILYPISKIPAYKNKVSMLNFINMMMMQSKKQIQSILILSILITIFSILTSFFFKNMVDIISVTSSKEKLLYIFIIFFTLYILKIISDFFRNKLLIYVNQKVDLMLTNYAFKQIISLPYHYYCNKTTGEIIERISDLSIVRNMISKVALSLFVDLPLTLFSIIFLYYISDTLSFIAIIIFVLYIINIMIFKPIFNKYINLSQEKKAKVTSYMVESISGFETIKGLGIENKIINKFEKCYINLLNNLFKFDNHYNRQYIIKELIHNIGFIIIIYVGCLLVVDDIITLGELLAFNALLAYFLEPIRNVTDLDTNIREAKSALYRILELFYEKEEKGIISKDINGNIKICNLTFSYNDRDYILKDLSLSFNQGEKIMIIGSSGSGKSTLLKLIKGYYEVKRNQILIDNVDINDYKKESFGNKLSYISQKEMLFTDSLYNNLSISNNYNNNEILNISKLCCVDEIINNNNLAYQMLIEENGFNLSGGEKQRIVLARTLLKPFNVLLIDEGLNQMDLNLERNILKNIFNKFRNKTIIIVSHRLENMDLFDKVVELKGGQVIKEVYRNG